VDKEHNSLVSPREAGEIVKTIRVIAGALQGALLDSPDAPAIHKAAAFAIYSWIRTLTAESHDEAIVSAALARSFEYPLFDFVEGRENSARTSEEYAQSLEALASELLGMTLDERLTELRTQAEESVAQESRRLDDLLNHLADVLGIPSNKKSDKE